MKKILTIARWEVLRLRGRFSGKSKFIILPVLLLAMVLSYSIYHQDFNLNKGLYTIGVSASAPNIDDKRFNVAVMDPKEWYAKLKSKNIDLFINGTLVYTRDDQRSQYAAGAVQKYLENQELVRISNQYDIDKAFPLRISIDYMDIEAAEEATAFVKDREESQLTVSDLLPEFSTEDGVPGGMIADIEVTEPEVATTTVDSDPAVRAQLDSLESGSSSLPEFKAEFVSEDEVIIPSLMDPPMPLAQVILAFLYVIPIFLVSVFFTSSFTEEKVNRKLIILMSAPVSRLQVMLGKMLPYYIYSVLVIIGVTLILKGSVWLALGIFIPVMLFIFAVYLVVALTCRTFKDQTFFSVLALSIITIYLVVPAMFTGVSNLSYISPLTLAVNMYRGESFGAYEYLLATTPLYLTFFLVMFLGVRVFNEEFLMGFKPLRAKVTEAIFMAVDKKHLNISLFMLSLLMVPLVFAAQLVAIVLVSNMPSTAVIWAVMLVSVVIEEIAKSLGIFVLLKNKIVNSRWNLLKLSFFSALGFWLGEKLLLVLTIAISGESSQIISDVMGAGMFNGWMLIVPLILHTVSTFTMGFITSRGSKKGYLLALISGSAIHAIYNFSIMLATGAIR